MRNLLLHFMCVAGIIIGGHAEPASLSLPVADEELAAHMVELQVLTHKLGLSVDAENLPLVKFYLHESRVKLEEIQNKMPEYEGSPVAVYIDHLSKPSYTNLDKSVKQLEAGKSDFQTIKSKYLGVIHSCNLCHASSGRPEIKIKHNPFNPYLQDFSTEKK